MAAIMQSTIAEWNVLLRIRRLVMQNDVISCSRHYY